MEWTDQNHQRIIKVVGCTIMLILMNILFYPDFTQASVEDSTYE
jgi:hypothetical protein